MEKIREFIGSHKKIVVPVIAAAVLLLACGFVLAAAALTGVDDGSSEQPAQFVKTEDWETSARADDSENNTTSAAQS